MLPRPPGLVLPAWPPPRRAPSKPPRPAAPALPFCLPRRASRLGAMAARMLPTELVDTPVCFEMPPNTLPRLPPKMWPRILPPSVRSVTFRLLTMLPALPAWSPRALAKASAPPGVEAFFCIAPSNVGRALVMTEDTCLESILRLSAMAPTASLPVRAPRMLVMSILLIVELLIECKISKVFGILTQQNKKTSFTTNPRPWSSSRA